MKYIPWDMTKLEDIVKLWNKELGNCFPMRKKLFKQNSFQDVNVFYKGSQIAVDENGDVIGFIIAKKWQDELDVGISKLLGWIQVLLVDSKYRNQGIGTKLLKHAEQHLKANGVNRILLGRDTWHYFPGIPSQYEDACQWFEKRGYEHRGTDFDLYCHYDKNEKITIQDKENVRYSLLSIEEKEAFLSFLHRCFPGRWEYEAIQYFQKGGTGREFLVLKKNNQIIGFCRMNDKQSPFIAQNVYWAPLFKEELGGIGPLGIDANERKNGYGLYIVEAAILQLRKRGIPSIVIDWTGLVDFYGKLGYKAWKQYESYQKNL